MSTLMIIVEREANISEPIFSFVGCGVLKVILSDTCETDVRIIINDYIKKNEIKILDAIKKDIKKYRKKWAEQVERICEEYGLDRCLPSFTTQLKIAKTNKVILVTSDAHGSLLIDIRFRFDPVSSILDEDTFDTLLRYGILCESLKLMNEIKDITNVARYNSSGETIVDKMNDDIETFQYEREKLLQEYEKVRNRISSEKFSVMYGKLKSLNILECAI